MPDSKELCSGRGKCECGQCKCSEENGIRYSGKFCQKCPVSSYKIMLNTRTFP